MGSKGKIIEYEVTQEAIDEMIALRLKLGLPVDIVYPKKIKVLFK